tara:strand:- start:111 stop:743 length:633 start_codon:yes stop_codon:yes gene_type:complete
MATKTATQLKAFFETGDQPTADEFVHVFDSHLNLTDGGTVAGAVAFGNASAYKFTSATATSATIAVDHSTDTAVPAIEQPAGTVIKDVWFINAGVITTGGNANDDFDFEIGTSVSGGELVASTALLDGASVTWVANTPLQVIQDGHGHAANQFVAGVGPFGGPATTEAIVPAATFYSAAARDIHVNFYINNTNAAVAATTVKVIMNFMYV